jgi:hypothetical protein
MNTPKIGQIAEYFASKVVVEAVDVNRKTMDINYHDSASMPPTGWTNRPWAELVDMGEGRIIWNHE